MRNLSAACIIQFHDSSNDETYVLLGYNKKKRGWENCGGKNEGNETVYETARRELKEETGLDPDVSPIQIVRVGDYEGDDGWFCAIFHAHCAFKFPPPEPPEPETHARWEWFPRWKLSGAVRKYMTPACENLLREHNLLYDGAGEAVST